MNFVNLWKQSVLFYLGGMAYMGLEVAFRGWSHGSMFLAGGTCFLLLGKLQRAEPRLPLAVRMVLGPVTITAGELAAGAVAWVEKPRFPEDFKVPVKGIASL